MAADVPNQAQTRWAYIREATANTTPASPSFITLRPRAGGALKINRPRIESSELRADRQLGSTFGGVGGGSARIPTLLFHETFMHDWLENVMMNTFATDTLLDGVTPNYNSIERRMLAGTNNVFDRLAGVLANNMAIAIIPNQEVTVDFDVMATSGSVASTAIAGSTYSTPAIGEAADYGDVSSISMIGLTSFSLTSLRLEILNNLGGRPKLAQRDLKGLRTGPARIRVTAEMYLEDAAYYAAAIANTVGTVSFTLGPLGGTSGALYSFFMPTVEIGDHDASDTTGDGILRLVGIAKANASLGAQLRIMKNQ